VSLRGLRLNNSEVTSLGDYLGRLPAIEQIEIIDCDVKTIPPSIQRLVDNGKLTLIRNGFELFQYQFAAEENHR